jgi:hypothetical protein
VNLTPKNQSKMESFPIEMAAMSMDECSEKKNHMKPVNVFEDQSCMT